jgi:protein-L-isoaspartate(D-aspartate) O-methyltransferase
MSSIRKTLLALAAAVAALASAYIPPARSQDDYDSLRRQMVEQQIERRGIRDPLVLAAMGKVPRHLFVPENIRRSAYIDRPLPIGRGQTISQPFIVALMTELARIEPGDNVLEVGTGSGYQAAILAEIGAQVCSIEIDCMLAERAALMLEAAGYGRVLTKCGDGYDGWPERAPFDAILVTAAPPRIPQPLKTQLKVGGILVIPVGGEGEIQVLKTITRTESGFLERDVEYVAFVPMTGKVQR